MYKMCIIKNELIKLEKLLACVFNNFLTVLVNF